MARWIKAKPGGIWVDLDAVVAVQLYSTTLQVFFGRSWDGERENNVVAHFHGDDAAIVRMYLIEHRGFPPDAT